MSNAERGCGLEIRAASSDQAARTEVTAASRVATGPRSAAGTPATGTPGNGASTTTVLRLR